MALSGPQGSHALGMSSSHHIALQDYAYVVSLVLKYQIVLISTGGWTWTFFPFTFQFSCQFWFNNCSWTHCRHHRFFSLYVSLQLCTHCRNASVQPMHLIAVQQLHLSYASLSLLDQDATGVAYNTQHLSELAVSQLEVHTVQYPQYHVKSFDTFIWLLRWSMMMLECLISSPFSGEYSLDFRIIYGQSPTLCIFKELPVIKTNTSVCNKLEKYQLAI